MYQLTNTYVVSGLATLGGLMQGFDVTSQSAIIGTDQYKDFFHHPSSVLQGGMTASMAGGSLLGALSTNLTGDRFGRRDSLAMGCVIFTIGSAIMSASQNVAMLIVSRVINGFAVGIFSCQAPLFIAEISAPDRRGRLITFQNWMIAFGCLVMYFVSYGCSYISSTASFRLPWGLQMVPALVLFTAVPFMPRSPRWLASKDRWEEAHKVLADLHGKGDRIDPLVLAELQEIKEKILEEREYAGTSWLELVKRKNIIRVQCAVATHLWSQMSGNNAIQYYIVYIFAMAGLQGNTPLISGSIQYCINVAVQIIPFLYMDHFRRRWALMAGSIFCATWLFAIAGLMANYGHAVPGGLNGVSTITWVVTSPHASKAIIACSYLFGASYALTWGPLGWLVPAEVLPMNIRNKATSIAVLTNWAGNFALTFFVPPAMQNIQWKTFVIFGTLNLVSFIHVFLLWQETKGKTLEEMDEVFAQSLWGFQGKLTQSRLVEEVKEAERNLTAKVQELEQFEQSTRPMK